MKIRRLRVFACGPCTQALAFVAPYPCVLPFVRPACFADQRGHLSAAGSQPLERLTGAEAGLLANKVAALENQLELSRVTSLSPSQIGGRLMQNPSWQIDSSADVDRLLGPAPSDIVAMATELLAALQQGGSLTIDSLAERERQARGNSNESKWAHEEEKLQYAMGFLLSTFQEIHAGHCCWTLHDTHAPQQGLEGHKGRMDYTFTTGERWWAQVLFLLKLKTKLRPQSITHKAAVGELVECARTALAHQPLERSHMFGIALSRDTIQVISIQKSVGSALLHTDMLPFALESDSPGWHLLVRVLSAGHGAHGFISKDPPVINLPPHRFMDFKLKDWRQLRPNAGSQTLHMEPATQIWRATHTIGDQLPQHVAVKTCLRAACENEVRMLQLLSGVPGVARLIATGETSDGDQPFIASAPFGRCLSFTDDAETVLSAIRSIVLTLRAMASLTPPIIHRDLSHGNIIVVDAEMSSITDGTSEGMRHTPAAYLIDLATAQSLPPEADVVAQEHPQSHVGTCVFMAQSVEKGEPHSISSDLESLFLVLVYVTCSGHVYWGNRLPHTTSAFDAKVSALSTHARFEECIVPKCREDLLPQVRALHRLFYLPEYNTNVDHAAFLVALQ
eukprot:TRINITY_DN5513_c0_g1_i1.p1 TRINITY_DN5513_c0_g1~~TRINITY_DN5513_c0_g1_i1.p1  ORF type:complete len:620 (+),score=52.61 TRINITY_DN5513_c0_g1_i1:98-1957(+)